jgi:hypothetical protein
MAARFFYSIPDAVAVKDPYEEVFSLFTTETNDTPWAHNRSVAQQSTRLELELDFTPAPSPVASRPGSRPDSRSSSSILGLAPAATTGLPADDAPPSSYSPIPGAMALDDPSSNNTGARVKTPTGKALLGSRKSSRNGSTKASSASLNKKPVVIHQSLSTLSQPGQTGTVVWDSSILMAKFLLSIQGLSIGCYRQQPPQEYHQQRQQSPTQQDMTGSLRNGDSIGREQIRRLEEQAEYLAVSPEGDLEMRSATATPEPSKSSLDPPTKRQLELNISREDQQRYQLKHPHSHDHEDSEDERDDGGDEDEDEDVSMDSTSKEEELVFNPASTSILELGSGCGLLGIVMAELCQDLLLTDQKPVLPLLVKNLRKNLDKKYFDQDASANDELGSTTSSSLSNRKKNRDTTTTSSSISSSSTAIKPCHIQVQELVWGQELDQDLKRGLGVDFVVATDVVYNESIVPKLVDTLLELCMVREKVRHELAQGHGDQYERLSSLLESQSNNNNGSRRRHQSLSRTVVLVAQELRTDYVHLAFLERLEMANFKMVRIPKQMMDPDFHSGYAIYACFLKRSVARGL